MNPLPVVCADVRRSWVGFLSVVGLVAIAVALGVAVSAQERALRKGSAQAADAFDLLVGAPGSPTQLVLTTVYLQPATIPLLSGSILRQLQEEAGAAYAAPIAFGDRYKGSPVVGSTVALITRLAEGRPFSSLNEAVVGADVALKLGDRFTPSHGMATRHADDDEVEGHHTFEYQVVGRLPRQGTPWDRAIVVPVEAVWAIHGLATGHAEGEARIGPPWQGNVPGVPAIVVKPQSVADAYRLRGKYRSATAMAVFPAEVLVELYGLLGDARDLLAAITVATQVLVVAAVMLAVGASLAIRRRQFAVLRALGASRGYIFACVWVLVSLMIAAGAALGLLLGWAVAQAISSVLSARTGIHLTAGLAAQEVWMVAALIAAALLLATLPAWTSYRQSVSAGLRS